MEFIKGSKRIIEDYGYWPTFHNDYIAKLTINKSSIEMLIEMQNAPESYEEYSLLITFKGVSNFDLKGDLYGTASVIFFLAFEKPDAIRCSINSSLGTYGIIEANEVTVRKLIEKIDLTDVKDSEELHKTLAKSLNFPEFYGMNWDAFYDTITGLITMPKVITLVGWNIFRENNSEDAKILNDLLYEYKQQWDKQLQIEYK